MNDVSPREEQGTRTLNLGFTKGVLVRVDKEGGKTFGEPRATIAPIPRLGLDNEICVEI
jgi:hypothetical protein